MKNHYSFHSRMLCLTNILMFFLKEWTWEQRDLLHTVHMLWYGMVFYPWVSFLISLSRKIGSQEINETVLEASLKPRRLERASGDKPGGIWSTF